MSRRGKFVFRTKTRQRVFAWVGKSEMRLRPKRLDLRRQQPSIVRRFSRRRFPHVARRCRSLSTHFERFAPLADTVAWFITSPTVR